MMSTSPELKLFCDTTRQLLSQSGCAASPRELYAADESFDRSWWQRGAELGWTALAACEQFGGGSISGSRIADLVVLATEFGRRAAPGPLLPVVATLTGLVEASNAAEHVHTIEALVAGTHVAAWAFSGDETPGRLAVGFTAAPRNGGYVVTGVAHRVEAAVQADVLLVPAVTPDGVQQFLISPDAVGVSLTRARSIDLARQYATVELDDVEVDCAARVQADATVLRRQIHLGLLLRCAEIVGAVEESFDMTLRWAFDRYSFGRPLASYQALKHRYAQLFIWVQACQATVAAAASALASGAENAEVLLSVAKGYVSEKSVQLVQDCIQLHGGIGVTWEHDLHLYLRRVALNANTFGTADDHLMWLADHADKEPPR